MNNWKLKINGDEYQVSYRVYHLTDGKMDYPIHQIEYDNKTYIGKTLEDVVSLFGKSLEEK